MKCTTNAAKTAPRPAPNFPGPRNPFGPREFADIADGLLARERSRALRLCRSSRFRRWGR